MTFDDLLAISRFVGGLWSADGKSEPNTVLLGLWNGVPEWDRTATVSIVQLRGLRESDFHCAESRAATVGEGLLEVGLNPPLAAFAALMEEVATHAAAICGETEAEIGRNQGPCFKVEFNVGIKIEVDPGVELRGVSVVLFLVDTSLDGGSLRLEGRGTSVLLALMDVICRIRRRDGS